MNASTKPTNVNYCDLLLSRKTFFENSLDHWKKKSQLEILRLTHLYKRAGIEHDVVYIDGSPFGSIVFRTTGTTTVNAFAKDLFHTQGGLKLTTTPILFLTHPFVGAAYEPHDEILPKTEEVSNQINDLDLLAKVATQKHAFLVNPLVIDKLNKEALLVRHELHHSGISTQRMKSGSDILGVRGVYSKNYTGPSYFGTLNIEELKVKLSDVVNLAKSMESHSFPGVLTLEQLQELTTLDLLTDDVSRVTVLNSILTEIKPLALATFRAAEALNNKNNRPTFFTHRSQIWARITLDLFNDDGTPSILTLTIPLPTNTSKSESDPNNELYLKRQIEEIGRIGLSVYNFTNFSNEVFSYLTSNYNDHLYSNWIKLLASIQGFNSFINASGKPKTSQDYVNIVNN